MNAISAEQLIEFEQGVAREWEAGALPYLIHLCGGNEAVLIEIFRDVKPGDWVFSSHRNHYHYLLSGGAPERLRGLIRQGRSMFVFERRSERMPVDFLCSSILAGTCALAAGVAWQIKQEALRGDYDADQPYPHVWCFLGDGAEDEGHFYEAARWVDGQELPCTFVLEDNNRSVDTSREGRHGPNYAEVVKTSAPFRCVRRYFYTPTYPHAGSGCDFKIDIKDTGNPWANPVLKS